MLPGLSKISFFLIVASVLSISTVNAQKMTVECQAGYQNMARRFTLCPIEVTVRNPGATLPARLHVEVRDYQATKWSGSEEITIQTGSNTYHSYLQAYEGYEQVKIRIENRNGRLLAATNTSLQSAPNETSLIAAFGESTSQLTSLYQTKFTYNGNSRTSPSPQATVGVVQTGRSSDLGKYKPGTLAAMDAVFLVGFLPREASPISLQALKDYALSGGTLIISATPDVGIFANPFYRQVLPGTVTGASQTTLPGGQAAFRAGFNRASDASEYRLSSGIPVWIKEYGRGAVCFLPVDLSQPAVLNMPVYRQMMAELLSEVTSYQKTPISFFDTTTQTKYQDLAAVPRTEPPSLNLVALFLVGYLTVLVPVNYAVLHRRDQKEKTWLTTPAIIASFTIIAYLTSLLIRGSGFDLHQIAISDYSGGGGSAQKHVIAGFYANSTRDFRMEGPRGGYFLATSTMEDNHSPWDQASGITHSVISSSGNSDDGIYQDIRAKMWTPQITRFSQTVDEAAPFTGSVAVAMRTVSGKLNNLQNRKWDQVWIVVDGRTYRVGLNLSGTTIEIGEARVTSPAAPSGLTKDNKKAHQLETAVYNNLQDFPYKEGAYVVAFDGNAKPPLKLKPEADSVKTVEAVICQINMSTTIVNREIDIVTTRKSAEEVGPSAGSGSSLAHAPPPAPGGGPVPPSGPYYMQLDTNTVVTTPASAVKAFYSANIANYGANSGNRRIAVRLSGKRDFDKSEIEVLDSRTGNYLKLGAAASNPPEYKIPDALTQQKAITLRVIIPPKSEFNNPVIKVRY